MRSFLVSKGVSIELNFNDNGTPDKFSLKIAFTRAILYNNETREQIIVNDRYCFLILFLIVTKFLIFGNNRLINY